MQSLTLALLRMLGSSCWVAFRKCVLTPALGTAAAIACVDSVSDAIGWRSIGGPYDLREVLGAKGLSVVEGA